MADKLKNLLLILLLAIMVALLVLTFYVSVRGSAGGQQLLQPLEEGDRPADQTPMRLTARPETLALLTREGVYLAREGADYARLYAQAEPLFQEAVGSAGQLNPITEEEYLALLGTYGVLLQYHAPQPWYLMQAWGGSEGLDETRQVYAAAMMANDQTVALLLTDRQGGRWLAETAASLSELEELCAAGGMPNAVLARESASLWQDAVLTTLSRRLPGLTANAPELVTRGELSQSVQALFGMNAYLTRVYQNTDGSLVYVESHSTISLSPMGDLTYTGTAGIDLELTAQGAARRAELCQRVYDLLSRLWEQAGASGQLSLKEAVLEGDSGLLHFGLHVDGLFLEREEGSWATVTVEEGTVTGLTVALRLLQPAEEHWLLPMHLAEATLSRGKAHLRLRLLEEGGVFVPQICQVTEK